MNTPSSRPAPSRTARALGLAGLIPFVIGAAATAWADATLSTRFAFALAAYAATIASFLGGLHWGLAARGAQAPAQYGWGVVPSLVAWGALLLPVQAALAALGALLVACYAVDRRVLPAQGLAGWLPLRTTLTLVAAASCAVAAFAVR